MNVLIVILCLCTIFFLISELASFMVLGWFMGKEETKDFLSLKKEINPRLNKLNSSILRPYEGHNFAIFKFSIWSPFSKYYIDYYGNRRVWKYGKLHKQIETWFKIANENKNKES